jgi:hypothetical protein
MKKTAIPLEVANHLQAQGAQRGVGLKSSVAGNLCAPKHSSTVWRP